MAIVEQRDVPIVHDWLGTLDGTVNAQIRPQVSGYLLSREYAEGTVVKKGALLFQIDPRIIQATLNQAEAQLAQAQAQLGRTELDVKRFTPLVKTGAISQQEMDNATQSNLAAQADVDAAKAAVDKAKVDLEFTKIIAPIDGIAGLANAQVGDLVSPSAGTLTTISTVDPIKVLFTVSEQEYMTFVSRMPRDIAARTAYRDQLKMQLLLPDGTTYPHFGKYDAVQRQVDPKTGTIQVTGTFPNPGNILRPGQFVRVLAEVSERKDALLVPQRAVSELQSLYQIAAIDTANTVQIRNVKVGERVGTQWVVLEGLTAGERVVSEGLTKVSQGTKVNVVTPTTLPTTSTASAP